MVFVIDKFIGLYWLVKRFEYCMEFWVKCVIVLFVIFFIVMYYYFLWIVGNKVIGYIILCMFYYVLSLMEIWSFFNYVDYVIVVIILYLMIVILFGFIILKFCMYKLNVR